MKIYADGSCIGNHLHDKTKRISHIAYIVYKDGLMLRTELKKTKVNTNQSAEWVAILEALKYCQKYVPGEQIEIFSDCKNVVNIANGKSQPRAAHMKRYLEDFKKYSAGLNVKISWVPRKENEAGKHIENNLDKMRKE